MTDEKIRQIQQGFGRKLQAAGIKSLQNKNLDDVPTELALQLLHAGIELEKLSKARDKPSN